MDPNTAARLGQIAVVLGFVVGLLLLRLGRGLLPASKGLVAGVFTAVTMLGWLATSRGLHARDPVVDAYLAALMAASLPVASLCLRWWRAQRSFRIASWIGVALSVFGVAGSLITMSMGARVSSQHLQVGEWTTLVATTAVSSRIPQRGVMLEVRNAVDGFPAFERSKSRTFVDGISAPLSEIELKAELIGSDITLTMHHGGSMLREVRLSRE